MPDLHILQILPTLNIDTYLFCQVLPDIGRSVEGEGDQSNSSSEAADQLRQAIDELQHDLMKLEMHLVEQIDVRQNMTLYLLCSWNRPIDILILLTGDCKGF